MRGPVFTHILLADEINRAPAKTQSALLEVMQEYQVTLEGQTLPLPKPFMVLATQNPGRDRRHLSAAGSAARSLPVQDRDRLSVGRRGNRRRRARHREPGRRRAAARRREAVPRRAPASRTCSNWSRAAARRRAGDRLRRPDRARDARLRRRRDRQRLARRARAGARRPRRRRCSTAATIVTPDDIKRIALPALRHRVALSPDALLEGRTTNDLLPRSSGPWRPRGCRTC